MKRTLTTLIFAFLIVILVYGCTTSNLQAITGEVVAAPASSNTLTLRPDGQGYFSQWANVGCNSGASE